MISSCGVNGAEIEVKFRWARAPWTRPSTLPSKLRLGMPAVSTRLESFLTARSATSECRSPSLSSLPLSEDFRSVLSTVP
eukprot:132664-Amphidinium_carterae.1